ncbi:hypothetical protein CK203_028431 [Vitis vinifera]|uniref:Uncharacterized protein n=1 Tax=Vitis vinifera TaxID=29760 RepID=A0A438J043_VITVI|nr:hypothetical protein CK203_028431 [Vitis vinifera]
MVRGAWAGSKHPARPFSPNYSLVIPDAKERLQDAAYCAEPDGGCPGVPRVCCQYSPQEMPKEVVPGEHYTAPGQKRGATSPPNKAPAKKRKLVKNGKGVKEPTPPKEFAPPPITHEAEYSLAAVARLANLAEEAASINHPDSPNPDVDAAEAVCATPMEEAGAESQSASDDPDRLALVLVKGPPSKRPRSARNLRSGLIGRLQDRQQEIEVSCSSAYDAHPEGAK